MPAPPEEQVLTARWVFPVAGPPLERGTISVRGERIAAVEPHGSRTPDLDLGNAALIPGLVNAHTHLDLSGLRDQVPPSPHFTDWLREVIRHRRGQSPEQVQADIRAGLEESMRFGTTLLGDIAAGGASWDQVRRAPVRAVVFHELLGLTAERSLDAITQVLRWLKGRLGLPNCRPGFSPHAPYSFRSQGLRNLAFAGLPMAIHLAESADEMELLKRHTGPFVPFLTELNVWDPTGLPSGVREVIELTRDAPQVLFAHGNYLPPDISLPRNATVVYCPRTHAAFGHPPHPFRELLAKGVRVALGTDSLASNPDLDLLAEARFLHELYPDLPGAVLLRMATLAGAEALGFGGEAGSLEPGKAADLVAVPLPDADAADPHQLLFAPGDAASAPRRSMVGGR